MAITVSCPTTRVTSIDQYVAYVEDQVDLRDVDSLVMSAPMLRALANDRSLIVRKLNERITNSLTGGELATAQALLLGRGDNFYVRANIWPAIADMANGRAYQDQFAYSIAHDHNFTFLTVNHLGPGYETEIYEYDYDSVQGYIGEPVQLKFLEKTKFFGDSVMLYRAGRDVHIQYPPTELTITINLMVSLPEVRVRDQYYFDIARGTIVAYPSELLASTRSSFIRLAGFVGDANTEDLLEDIAARHPCRRTRLAAFESLSRQQPTRAAAIWEAACRDRSALVATTARRKLRDTTSG